MALPVLTAVLPLIGQVINRLFPDPDEAGASKPTSPAN